MKANLGRVKWLSVERYPGQATEHLRRMDQLYLSSNESDGSAEDKGETSAIFLCFYLLAVMDEEIEGFCLSIPSVNLLARNIP
ncbi:MAG: hypothetical protein CSA21_00450 [Deltaproteobacteria bacterium]|nr:MAG: hypothetical protein CSA21_00450 [Deltaproteobacteria bacterium]